MTKAIIIAAGMGKRLRPLTKNTPKCLLKIKKKKIIETQIEVFNHFNIKKINIITGYKREKFKKNLGNFFFNKDYKNNNILNSLFYAKEIIKDNILISYSDIIFKKKVIAKIIKSKANISILVDIRWQDSYKGRSLHPISEAEKVIMNKKKNLIQAGKNLNLKKVNGEFIGILKLNKNGCKIFKNYYNQAKQRFKNKAFFNAKSFKKAYITDFLNYLVLNKIIIKCVNIKAGWMEIDTIQDFKKAQNFYKVK